jgi:hypothetical protein
MRPFSGFEDDIAFHIISALTAQGARLRTTAAGHA